MDFSEHATMEFFFSNHYKRRMDAQQVQACSQAEVDPEMQDQEPTLPQQTNNPTQDYSTLDIFEATKVYITKV